MDLRRSVVANAVSKAGFAEGIGPRDVVAIFSDSSVDRMGDIVEASGCRLDELRNGLVVLWQHDADHPIARCSSVWRSGDSIRGRVVFPPEGTSVKSDETLRLVKTGVVDSLSIGFQPHDAEPIRGSPGCLRFTDWSLLEVSFVSVPANANAVVTAKRRPESSAPQSRTPNLDAIRAVLAELKADPGYQKYRRDKEAAERWRRLDAEIDREVRKVVAAREAERAELDLLFDAIRADAKKYGIIR